LLIEEKLMSNPSGPATKARTETQGIRARRKSKDLGSDLSKEQKKLKKILLKHATAEEKKAFDLGIRSNNLPFLSGYIFSQLVKIDGMDIPDRTKVTTLTKWFDMLRRIADRLDTGSPSIPDAVALELVTVDEIPEESDLPEVEGF